MKVVRQWVSNIPAYWVVASCLLLLTVAVLYLTSSNNRLVTVASQNKQTLEAVLDQAEIVKAATGCKKTRTVEECEKVLLNNQSQLRDVFVKGINAYTTGAFECHRTLPQNVSDAVFEHCIEARVGQ